eukprot:1055895-Prymnesium_polylepis.1
MPKRPLDDVGPCLGVACGRPCCIKPRKPYSDDESGDDDRAPPAVPAAPPAPLSPSASTAADDAARGEVLLGERIMVGQRVRLRGLKRRADLNGAFGRTTARPEAVSYTHLTLPTIC